jgi:hypothetical protein
MNYILLALTGLIFLLPGSANADTAPPIETTSAYAYATTPVQKNGAVFMEITNHSDSTDTVIAASADIATTVELHTHIMNGDMMMMREVDGYELLARETTKLHPMGHHIMLMGLHAPLKAGEHFPLTLSFEHHDPIIVSVEIKNPGDM